MPMERKVLIEQLMSFIEDKEACTRQILESLDHVGTISRGMDTLITALEVAEPDKVNLPKALIAVAKSVRNLSNHTQITGMLALIFVNGGNFDTDVALMLNRLGHGQEAMKTIFEKKMQGG